MNARRMQTFCDTYKKSTFFKKKFEFWDTFSKKIEKISSATEFFSIFLSDRLTDGVIVWMGYPGGQQYYVELNHLRSNRGLIFSGIICENFLGMVI